MWVDPGSFTSCYAEYNIGERWLVFGYGGLAMPSDTSVMSVLPGQAKPKPLPAGIDQKNPPKVYSAPECSGSRLIQNHDQRSDFDTEYLRQYKNGKATPSIRGRVTEDSRFGIFGFDRIPGLQGAAITLSGRAEHRSTVTDAGGYYAFAGTPAGTYRVASSVRGYSSPWAVLEVTVPPDGCGAADFDMIGSGSISGTLLDSVGRPAAGIRVEALRLNLQGKPIYYAQKQTNTDDLGRYRFEELPRGSFRIGINLFQTPDPKTPYVPTPWSDGVASSISLSPGERRQISPFRLPRPSPVRTLEVEVHWPDGRPADGVDVWGEVSDRAATHEKTDSRGAARLDVLEGVRYKIEAKVWTDRQDVTRSGITELTQGQVPFHLKLVLDQHTKRY
jgi:hypothetical protein